MGPFTVQANGMLEFVIACLHDLTHSGQPAPQRLKPGASTIAFGRTQNRPPRVLAPACMAGGALETFVDHIGSMAWSACSWPLRLREAAEGEKRVRQRLILCAGCPKAKPCDDTNGIHGNQQMQALIPPQPITPANIGEPRQPAPRRLASRVGPPELSSAS
jgi:hypothetical protein